MPTTIAPLAPERLEALSRYLKQGFGASDEATFLDPAVLRWKYLEGDTDGAPLSWVAESEGAVVGHAGRCATAFVGRGVSGGRVSTAHVVDWVASEAHAPIGALLLLRAARESETLYAVGGTADARAVIARLGYRRLAGVPNYERVLRANPARRPDTPAWTRPLRLARDAWRLLAPGARVPSVPVGLQRIASPGAEVAAIAGQMTRFATFTERSPERLERVLRFPRPETRAFRVTNIKRTRKRVLQLEPPFPVTLELGGATRHATLVLLNTFKRAPAETVDALLDHLGRRAEVDVDRSALARDLFMSWDDARSLLAAGLAIGSHTATHPVLSRLPAEAQRHELAESRTRLEHALGHPVRALAYPVGSRDAFTDETRRLARETGYEAAFSFYGGTNPPAPVDPWDLRRVGVQYDLGFDLFRLRMVRRGWVSSAAA